MMQFIILFYRGESKEISTKKRYVKEEERVKKRSNLEELEEEIVKEGHGLVKRFCLDLGNLPYFVLILLQSPHFPPILTRQIQRLVLSISPSPIIVFLCIAINQLHSRLS